MPLTRDELADLAARAKIREDFTAALVRAIDSDGYAGAYIDQLRNGQPVLMTTDPASLSEALKGVEQSAALAEVRIAEYSEADLEATKELVKTAQKELESSGIDVVSIGLDTSGNRVIVGINGSSKEIEAQLRSRFGQAIAVREARPGGIDACTVASCWPMKGGLRVRLQDDPINKYCTAGFMVRKSDSGALALLTAGHCIALNNNPGQDTWGHESNPPAALNFGYEAPSSLNQGYHTWFEGSNGDVALIVLNSTAIAALDPTLNLLHIADPDSNGTVGSVKPPSQQLQFDSVCRMGHGTYKASGNVQGVTCGQVGLRNVDNESCNASGSTCYTINHTWEVDFDSVGGDSGGPVFHQIAPPNLVYSAYGTHVHSWVTGDPLPKTGWYTPIFWGEDQYDASFPFTYTVCVTAAC